MGTRLAVVFYDKYEEVNKEKNEMKIMEYCEGGGSGGRLQAREEFLHLGGRMQSVV